MARKARYDGHADWYESWNKPLSERNAPELAALLGPGDGLCLDIGCGAGHYFATLAATGRTVVGLDFSADQLLHARARSPNLVRADAAVLPFADGTFQTVVTLFISTDVDDYASVLTEGARVLAPGGLLVFYGVHPCFNGPHIEWLDDGGVRAHPTYRQVGWHEPAPWWGQYVRPRVGMRHNPLADLLNSFIAAHLTLEHVAELSERPVPNILGIRARKISEPRKASEPRKPG